MSAARAEPGPERLTGVAALLLLLAVAVGLLGQGGYYGPVQRLVGLLVVAAAVTFDPNKARGMDAALRQVAAQPFGPWLLSLMALGLMCFGVYSLAEARYRRL
jgi:hypothetical protein